MVTEILALRPNGETETMAQYTLPRKQALIAFYMQTVHGNFNTWEYPEEIPEIQHGMGGTFYEGRDGTIYEAVDATPMRG